MAIRRARSFWLVAATSVLVVWTAAARRVPAASSQAAPGARPNVVVVLVDDMGWSDIGPFGSEIATPGLDVLAGRGVRFTQFYTTPRCSPTRASLLTGLYSHQAGMGHLDNVIRRGSSGTTGRLNDQSVTMAEVLRDAGYFTAMSGKWHLGQDNGTPPWDRGFERTLSLRAGGMFFPNQNYTGGDNPLASRAREPLFLNGAATPRDAPVFGSSWYATYLWTEFGLKFVDEARQANKPFFLYLPFNAPHFPLMAPAELIAKHRGKYKAGWDRMRQERYQRQVRMGLIDAKWPLSPREPDTPPWNSLSDHEKDRFDHQMAVYAAMIEAIDTAVGTLVKGLEARGVLDNTLIFFMSDNGANAESGPDGRFNGDPPGGPNSDLYLGMNWAAVGSTPFRRFKHFTHEGGISSPLIVSWPRVIAANRRGAIERQPAHVIDIMATVTAATGAKYPSEYRGRAIQPMEGIDLRAALDGRPLNRPHPLFWEHEGNRAVRSGNWKIVSLYQEAWELYDIAADRVERRNVAARHPDIVKRLSDEWDVWAKRTNVDPWPGPARLPWGDNAPGRGGRPSAAARPAPAASVMKHWTADNGNGTYSTPLFHEEFEDPDVIRVGGDYYLVGTTMHMNPGVQIMHSRDLVNWELAGYAIDRLDLGPAYRLEGGNIYGRGIWAPCIRYHQGMFYIFSNVNGAGLQVLRSRSIQGPWERNQLPGRHDPSVLFDDDLGKIFIISGARAPYPIEELAPDLRSFVPGVRHQLVVPEGQRMGEGHHLYKIQGKYFDISAIPGGTVDQMVASADSIDGPWTVERMVQGESLGVPTVTPARVSPNDRGLTLHQGGMVDTPSGEWWSIIMSDHGSAGRMVALVPITWDHGFPLIGLPGNLRKAPNTWVKPHTGFTQAPKPAFVHDDAFNGTLNPEWQWNHVPDDSKWSLTEKPGVLRLHSLAADNFYNARNSISQRPPAPESIMTVELDTSGLVAGDIAGLGLVSTPYAWIGVSKTAEGSNLLLGTGAAPGRRGGAAAPPVSTPVIGAATPPAHLWLRVHCNFDTDLAVFSWSADGRAFTAVGTPFTMTFQLTTFQGVRPALFNFNTSGQAGGYADFDNYTVEEPRARGIEREIPMGKIIALTSGADGSVLAGDTRRNVLVSAAPDRGTRIAQNARFQVIDLGLGRVALKASSGRFVSVDQERVALKQLGKARPGVAESFQWVNLMRGDMMLMSLTNHRYLATTPDAPGPVTVTALGATAARKSGAEFRWKAVAR